MHGVPALAWSSAVASSAQQWADRGVYEHSSSYNIAPPAGPAGENLAAGTSIAYFSALDATEAWYTEVKHCQSWPGCRSYSDVVGHFTAMIWKGATHLGCGIGTSGTSSGGTTYEAFYVCRYKAGDSNSCDTPNMGSCYEANVFPASQSESACAGGSPTPTPTPTPTPSGTPSTTSGCACRQQWTLEGHSTCNDYCCNPDGDTSDWCFVVDEGCQGTTWGYCGSGATSSNTSVVKIMVDATTIV